MAKFILDAYAWIEYFEGSEKGKKVAGIVEDDSNEIFTSSATAAEVISKFLRANKDIKIALMGMNSLSTVISVKKEIGFEAGSIHFEAKKANKEFGMLDAFVLATARSIGAKISTGDEDFRPFREAVFI